MDCTSPSITLRQFTLLLNFQENFFQTASVDDLTTILNTIPDCSDDQEDFYTWSLEKNGTFTVKSFYNFLIDGGLCSQLCSQFWKTQSPNKITLFCWLVKETKFLLLRVFKKGSNPNVTDTCILYHNSSETVNIFLSIVYRISSILSFQYLDHMASLTKFFSLEPVGSLLQSNYLEYLAGTEQSHF